MKNTTLALLVLVTPLLAKAEITKTLKELEVSRKATSLCSMTEETRDGIEKSLGKIKKFSKRAAVVVGEVVADLDKSRASCDSREQEKLKDLKAEVQKYDAKFPAEINESYDPKIEFERDAKALVYIQSLENNACGQIAESDLYNQSAWHNTLLKSGWPCIASNYKRVSQDLNKKMKYDDAQEKIESLNKISGPALKKLFKDTFKNGVNGNPLKIAFVPHLTWENGRLNTLFPYKLFTRATELTSYSFLTSEFKKLGVKASIVSRNSLNPLDVQVEETKKNLLKLDGPHLIISRSMGARVMRELVAKNEADINAKVSTWLNIGGTPHGSVIAAYKTHPDTFYAGPVSAVVNGFKLPIKLIAKDPRLPRHLVDSLFAGLMRTNLETMIPSQARQISESPVPVMNAIYVRSDYERATKNVDPVWMHMLQYGPTEGSSPISGAAVDTGDSMRLVMDSDHLAFWKYTPKEAIEIYMRLLIHAAQSGLMK